MKHISEMTGVALSGLQKNSMRSQEETSRKMALPKHWVSALFKKFQARYLHRWTSAIDGIEEVSVDEWGRKLAGLTGDQIRHGLDSWSGEWPPTADEFRDCCLGKKSGMNEYGLNYTPEYYRQPERRREKLLSNGDRDVRRAKIAAGMADLKQALRK